VYKRRGMEKPESGRPQIKWAITSCVRENWANNPQAQAD
jgi:hypothetical protein